jgi:hypothetical protein
MDAVVLMNAVAQPAQAPLPAPKRKRRSGVSPNAALITGIGVLLLALGIGVLIGRSGHQEVAQTAAAPIVIHSGGGEDATAGASTDKATTGGGAANAKTKKQKAAAEKAAEAHPAAEEIIKPTNGVKLAPPTVKPGDKCESGAAGCEDGEFTGNFFGE